MELSTTKIKKFRIFLEMELFSPNINKFLIRKLLLYFEKTETPQKFLLFQERYIQDPTITELFYILGKVYSKPWYNGTFLYFGKGIFREP